MYTNCKIAMLAMLCLSSSMVSPNDQQHTFNAAATEALKSLLENCSNLENKKISNPFLWKKSIDDLDWQGIVNAIDNGADWRLGGKIGNWIMFAAAQSNQVACLRALLNKGARVDECGNGHAVLAFAVEYNSFEAAEFLLNNGADVEVITQPKAPIGDGHLHVKRAILELLLQHKLNIEKVDDKGNAILHRVADVLNVWHFQNELQENVIANMQLLVDHGANLCAKNNDGKTPYDILNNDMKASMAWLQCTKKQDD